MEQLDQWFLKHRRDFPWREKKSPYRVWVSEIMLQQTRASVVIPYFNHWMEKFPTIEALAKAPIEKVIKTWEGLGYYSRARNLHRGAKEMLKKFQGEIPDTEEALLQIPGLGPYTVGAILSFGFHKKAVAMDGNVIRVISRYFAIETEIERATTRSLIKEKVNELLDIQRPWITMEAFIELGALICKPKPLCLECPLQSGCKAFAKNMVDKLPLKKQPMETIFLKRWVAIIQSQGKVLVEKGETGKVMADLYQFPYFEQIDHLPDAVFQKFSLQTRLIKKLKTVTHSFTKFKAQLYPFILETSIPISIKGWDWIEKEKLSTLPFSSGHRKILKEILQ